MRLVSDCPVCARYRFRTEMIFAAILFCLTGCKAIAPASHKKAPGSLETTSASKRIAGSPAKTSAASAIPVKLDIYLMSKCPFAANMLNIVLTVMNRMEGRLDLNLYYIGNRSENGFTSMHGSEEVDGDILALCAEDVGKKAGMRRFVECLLKDFRRIPSEWERCADIADLDLAAMNNCFTGERGRSLLENSFRASADRGIRGSPTIFIDGDRYDGPKIEPAFSRAVCLAMRDPKDPYCNEIPTPGAFPVTIVFDKRCTGNECLSQLDAKNLTFNFEGAQLSKLDYSSPEGRALYERSGQKHLPIVIFGADVVKQKEGFEKIKHKLLPFDDTNDFVYPIGQSWNPTAEICDDGVDNTGNGKIDCADPTCDESIICRKEQKGHIDLFLTPNCSFGRRALVETAKVLEEFNKKKPSVDLALIYLGHVQNGKPVSMFGSAETIESLRQVCAQKYYKKNHKFLEYAACRASRDKEDNWKECLAPGMNMNVLEKCADGEEGEGLLISSIQQAESLRISISPVWLFNNRFKTIGLLTREKIRAELCRRNPDIDNCR